VIKDEEDERSTCH